MKDIEEASARIFGLICHTPLVDSFTEKNVRFKMECYQPFVLQDPAALRTGWLSLPEEKKRSGIITASSGNHGLAVAYVAAKIDVEATIVLPTNVVREKLEMIKSLGARVDFFGTQEDERVSRAREIAKDEGMTLIGSFNEPEIIAGQGTCGLEIIEDAKDIDTIFVPIGGGGLISGIASAVKLSNGLNKTRIIGVQPVGAASMFNSWKKGETCPLETTKTIADGTSIRVPGDLTFSIVQRFVDDIILVSDEEILDATLRMVRREHVLAEPSGAESFAGLLKYKQAHDVGNAVSVVSGGNISWELLKRLGEK